MTSDLSPLTGSLSTLSLAESDLKQKDKSSSKLPMPLDLYTLLPDAKTPWHISDTLQKRFDTLPSTDKYKKVEVKEGDPEWKFVQTYFRDQCPDNRIIQKIHCLRKYNLTQRFEGEVLTMEEAAASHVFAPSWDKEEPIASRKQAIKRWQALTAPFSPFYIQVDNQRVKAITHTKILPLWHGTSAPICDSIAQTGFTFFGKHGYKQGETTGSTDAGYFGSGIYFTNSAKYAAEIYSAGHLLLAWVSMREPYPVVADSAVTPPHKPKDMQLLEGHGAYKKYNAHYIPVISVDPKNKLCSVYYPCAEGQIAAWDELVVFREAQTLPRFWVELGVALPKAPSSPTTVPPAPVKETIGTLLTKILDLLEEETIQQNPTLSQLLESQSQVLIALNSSDTLNASQQSFYQWSIQLLNEQKKVREFVIKKLTALAPSGVTPSSPMPSVTSPKPSKEEKAPAEPILEPLPFTVSITDPALKPPAAIKHVEVLAPSKIEYKGEELKFSSLTINLQTIQIVQVLSGHINTVSSLTVAGNYLFSGSRDKSIRMWEIMTGKHLYTFFGHASRVNSLVVAGKYLFSGSHDKSIRMWDLESGKHNTLIGHNWAVSSLALDGKCLFSGSHDKTIRMWEWETGKHLYTLEGHTKAVSSLALDGKYLFSGSHDKTIRVWEWATGKCLATLKGHTDGVENLAVAGKYLFSGSSDKTIRMWEWTTGKCLATLRGHTSGVESLVVAGQYLFSGSSHDKSIQVWEPVTGKCLGALNGHTGGVESLTVAGQYLFSGSSDKTIRVWNLCVPDSSCT